MSFRSGLQLSNFGWFVLLVLSIIVGCTESSRPEPQDSDSSTKSTSGTNDASMDIVFREVSQEIGVVCRQPNGEESGQRTVLEFLGSGVGVVDIDLDDRLDLVFAGGGTISRKQSIQGNQSTVLRQEAGQFQYRDVTVGSRVDTSQLYSHGVFAADFNNDGFVDLLFTGWTGVEHWVNCGDGTFVAEREITLPSSKWYSSAAAGDFNADGILDLYVTRYADWSWQNHPECLTRQQERDICNPRMFEPTPDEILLSAEERFASQRDERFRPRSDGRGLSALAADLDGDSFTDVYVANDMTANFLYRNDAGTGFTEEGLLSGTAYDQLAAADGSMGLGLSDYNGDGLPDIWVTNYEHEQFALYQNVGSAAFVHTTEGVGLAQAVGNRVGWGTSFRDFDSDGDPDLFAVAGHPQFDADLPREQLPVLIENLDSRFFRDVRSQVDDPYFSTPQNARSVCSGDLNRDGRVDLVVTNLNGSPSVLQNQSDKHQQLRVRLIGTSVNRDAIGATVTLTTSLQNIHHRWVVGGGSYLATSDADLTFALQADERPNELQIRWPGGGEQTVRCEQNSGAFSIIENRDACISIEPATK